VVPKLESFLNQSNRIPSASDFDDNFETHFSRLVDTLQGILATDTDGNSDLIRTESVYSEVQVLTLSSDDDTKKSKEERAVEAEWSKKDQMLQLLQLFNLELTDGKFAAILGDLKFLCRNEECSAFAIKARAISRLMKYAMGGDRRTDVHLQAVSVLRNLTGIPDDGVITGYSASSAARNSLTKQTAKLIILEADFLERLVEMLSTTNNAALATQIAIVVGNVADISWIGRDEDGKQGWGKLGGGVTREAVLESQPQAALIRALSLGSACAMAACYAMKNICYDSDNHVRKTFARHGLREALSGLIRNHQDPEPIEMAIWLIKRLMWCSDSGHGDQEMAKNFMPLVVDVIAAAAKAEMSPAVRLQAFDALHTMSFGTGEGVAMGMVKAGAVPILLQCCVTDHAMKETVDMSSNGHWSQGGLGQRTRVCAALALNHISEHSSSAAALVEANAVPLLCRLLKSGPLLKTKRWPGGEHLSGTLLGIAGRSSLVGALCKELGVETTAAAIEAIQVLAVREDAACLYAW